MAKKVYLFGLKPFHFAMNLRELAKPLKDEVESGVFWPEELRETAILIAPEIPFTIQQNYLSVIYRHAATHSWNLL